MVVDLTVTTQARVFTCNGLCLFRPGWNFEDFDKCSRYRMIRGTIFGLERYDYAKEGSFDPCGAFSAPIPSLRSAKVTQSVTRKF